MEAAVSNTDLPGLPTKASIKKMTTNERHDANFMDNQRTNDHAYDYLCHIGEAKEWMEACLGQEIESIDKLDEELRNGITLAHLAKAFQPTAVKRIFEDKTKLQFRHSDNINYFFSACRAEGLPEVFFFELTDLYEKKNIPKVIYCIHAFSYLLSRQGKAPHIKNLVGHLEFSADVLAATSQGLEDAAVSMPAFGNMASDFAKEMKIEETEEEKAEKRRLEEVEANRIKEEKEAADREVERQRLEVLEIERARLEAELAAQVAAAAEVERLRLETLAIEAENLRIVQEAEALKVRATRELKAAIQIQAAVRGHKQYREYQGRLKNFKNNESLFVRMQARYKGRKAREAYIATQTVYKAKEKQIILIQSWYRGVSTRKLYKELLLKKGQADVRTVQKYLQMLDTGDDSFEDDKEVEDLREKVIHKIRQNLAAETHLNELDGKVALLVKNRISLEEVSRFKSKDMRAALAKSAAVSEKEVGILTLRGNDRDTKEIRKRYEELFYVLQTQPAYLSSLLFIVNKTSAGSATKFLEQIVLTVYGYAQNSREEFLFLRLIEECIQVEVTEAAKADETLRENPLFVKLALQYTRGAKEREYLRGLLRPLLDMIMSDNSLDLDTDPISIYKGCIREEEGSTGKKSTRSYDVTSDAALADPQVNLIYLANLGKLKTITDTFLVSIVKSVDKMPFGIRFIAMKMKEKLKAKFPKEDKEINQVIGNLLYYRYINPVIISPEAFDVIETVVAPAQRKNLAEVAKTLHQIAVGKTTIQDAAYFKYFQQASAKFSVFLREASSVVSVEEYFGLDEFLDTGKQERHKIYITADEIVQVHHSLVENLQQLPSTAGDPLRVILTEMGIPPALGTAAKGPGSEIALNLTNRFANVGGEESLPLKKLLKETKRLVLLVVRFSNGKSLLDILEQFATSAQETKFAAYIDELEAKKVGGSTESLNGNVNRPLYKAADDSNLSFQRIKIVALESMAKLEGYEVVTKKDHYQSMLDSIVEDMLTKQRRRASSNRELLSLRRTMVNLTEKSTFLDDSSKSYNDYIEACMAQLTNKNGKVKKAPLPFSKQYYHLQSIKKSGEVPQFGSFKYTAAELHKKGVLISIQQTSVKQFGLINLTISSSEAGIFTMEVTLLGKSVAEKETLRLDDLLQSQYNKIDVITLFDMAEVNLNLLIFLINKKFYA